MVILFLILLIYWGPIYGYLIYWSVKDRLDSKKYHIDIIYEIDYILDDDSKLINADNVKKAVDLYINNYKWI